MQSHLQVIKRCKIRGDLPRRTLLAWCRRSCDDGLIGGQDPAEILKLKTLWPVVFESILLQVVFCTTAGRLGIDAGFRCDREMGYTIFRQISVAWSKSYRSKVDIIMTQLYAG